MPLARSYKFDAYVCIGIGEELSFHYTIDWVDHQDRNSHLLYNRCPLSPDVINDHKFYCRGKPDHLN